MCLAVPGQIVQLEGDSATVDFQGNRMRVCCALTPSVQPGDWVLVHAGFAISELDEQAARETWAYLNEAEIEVEGDNTIDGNRTDAAKA